MTKGISRKPAPGVFLVLPEVVLARRRRAFEVRQFLDWLPGAVPRALVVFTKRDIKALRK
jgi:hypothetical protein